MSSLWPIIIIVLLINTTDGLRESYSENISKKINSGECVNISNKMVNQSIMISKLIIDEPIIIDNCLIVGDVSANGIIFNNRISFKNTVFLGKVNFLRSCFNETTLFKNAIFKDTAEFSASKFRDANYGGGQFFENVFFTMCNFHYSDFNNTIFYKDAVFDYVNLTDVTLFDKANFKDDSYFRHATFAGDPRFDDALFYGIADFYKTTFPGEASFYNSKFYQRADFSRTNFSNAAFEGSSFSGIADFRMANYQTLDLRDITFDRMLLSWKEAKNNLICDKSFYLYLIKSYKDLGLFEEADDCYYYFKEMYPPTDFFSKCIDQPLKYFYGWGVKPFNAFVFSILFTILFGLYFWKKTDFILDFRPKDEFMLNKNNSFSIFCEISNNLANSYLLKSIYFSARVFASAITSHVSDPSTGTKSRNAAKIEQLIAQLLAALFLIAVTKTIIREII